MDRAGDATGDAAVGMRHGLLTAIKLGLELKFGTKGLDIYPGIKKIQDVEVLETISEVIRTAQSMDEINPFLK